MGFGARATEDALKKRIAGLGLRVHDVLLGRRAGFGAQGSKGEKRDPQWGSLLYNGLYNGYIEVIYPGVLIKGPSLYPLKGPNDQQS